MKVKIFVQQSPDNIEAQINRWLKENNDKINFQDLRVSAAANGNITVVILYQPAQSGGSEPLFDLGQAT